MEDLVGLDEDINKDLGVKGSHSSFNNEGAWSNLCFRQVSGIWVEGELRTTRSGAPIQVRKLLLQFQEMVKFQARKMKAKME